VEGSCGASSQNAVPGRREAGHFSSLGWERDRAVSREETEMTNEEQPCDPNGLNIRRFASVPVRNRTRLVHSVYGTGMMCGPPR
jgi:hypothetical protein